MVLLFGYCGWLCDCCVWSGWLRGVVDREGFCLPSGCLTRSSVRCLVSRFTTVGCYGPCGFERTPLTGRWFWWVCRLMGVLPTFPCVILGRLLGGGSGGPCWACPRCGVSGCGGYCSRGVGVSVGVSEGFFVGGYGVACWPFCG